MPTPARVFVSYARHDRGLAQALLESPDAALFPLP